MAERDRFERDVAAALRTYAEDAPTVARPAELYRRFATTYPHRRRLLARWDFGLTPAVAWALLLAALLLALVVVGLLGGIRLPNQLISLVPSPTPTVTASNAATLTPSPIAPATPTPGSDVPTRTHSVTPTTVAPTPSTTPTIEPNLWGAPLQIASGAFFDGAMTVDASGNSHLAVTGRMHGQDGLWYGTNKGGEWAWTLIPKTKPASSVAAPMLMAPDPTTDVVLADTQGEHNGELAIATDGDGTVWIAYTHFGACADCTPNASVGVFYTTNAAGRWSDPAPLAGAMFGQSSIAVPGGHLFAAFADNSGIPGPRGEVRYGTDESGDWVTERIAATGGTPRLYLAANGLPQIVFFDDTTHLASLPAAGGLFAVADLGGPSTGLYGQLSAMSPAGDIWTTFWEFVSDESSGFRCYGRVDGNWSGPVRDLGGDIDALEVDSAGAAHTLGESDARGLLYGTIVGDVSTNQSIVGSGVDAFAVLALDSGDRPHVVFGGYIDGEQGLFELLGPAVP